MICLFMGRGRDQKNKQISFSILIFHKLDEISKVSMIFFLSLSL